MTDAEEYYATSTEHDINVLVARVTDAKDREREVWGTQLRIAGFTTIEQAHDFGLEIAKVVCEKLGIPYESLPYNMPEPMKKGLN